MSKANDKKSTTEKSDVHTAVSDMELDKTAASEESIHENSASATHDNLKTCRSKDEGLGTARSEANLGTCKEDINTCRSEANIGTARSEANIGTCRENVRTARPDINTCRSDENLRTARSETNLGTCKENVTTCRSEGNLRTARSEAADLPTSAITCRSLDSLATSKSKSDLATAAAKSRSETSVTTARGSDLRTATSASSLRTAVPSLQSCSMECLTAIDSQALVEEVVSVYCMDIDPGSATDQEISFALPSQYQLADLELLKAPTSSYGMKLQAAAVTASGQHVSATKSEYLAPAFTN